MNTWNGNKYPIGSKVRVKREYQYDVKHRETVGTVIRHEVDEPFLDNIVQFENGEKEAFEDRELLPAE